MYDICCIGHITADKIITPRSVNYLSGGTAFYFSKAIRNMDVSYCLVTAVADEDRGVVEELQTNGLTINALSSRHTVLFENIYSENQDNRTQRVLQEADPFTAEQLEDINAAIFHLGPLLADDIPLELIRTLARRGAVALDVQGYLREVRNKNVFAVDWPGKREALEYVSILKANEHEAEALTGYSDMQQAAEAIAAWGVKEVVITLGSKGSVIYADNKLYQISAYQPVEVIDATGCGDTYMAGYLYQRIKQRGIQESGEFAAAMSTIKIESSGPFDGLEEDVRALLKRDKSRRGQGL